jgi:hypothetical protein
VTVDLWTCTSPEIDSGIRGILENAKIDSGISGISADAKIDSGIRGILENARIGTIILSYGEMTFLTVSYCHMGK